MTDLLKIKCLCLEIVKNEKIEDIIQLGNIINAYNDFRFNEFLQKDVLATLYLILKKEAQNTSKLKEDHKLIVVNCLKIVLNKIKIENQMVFFNLYGFLLQEIYNTENHTIKIMSEEYKLAILTCIQSLLNSISLDLTLVLYNKENGKKLCKMIYVLVELANREKFRNLRIEAIECLMTLFKVQSNSDHSDIVLRNLIAESFSYFLPGIALCLKNVALIDDKVGFKLIGVSIKAFGRIIALLMQDYKTDSVESTPLEQAKSLALYHLNQYYALKSDKEEEPKSNEDKIKDYMEAVRDIEWFKKSDKHLAKLLMGFKNLTQHPIAKVREELMAMCKLLLETCPNTIPTSNHYLVEILIILSEDEDKEISEKCKVKLEEIHAFLSKDESTFLMNSIQTGFHERFLEIPTVFNGLDDDNKIAILKLVTGYVNLFHHNLYLNNDFKHFMRILLHLCEFEVDVTTFEENIILDLNCEANSSIKLWKNLKFLKDEKIREEFKYLCHALVRKTYIFEVFIDYLINIYNEGDERKEATYLMNQLISGLKDVSCENKKEFIKPVFSLYIDPENWDLETVVYGNVTLKEVRSDIQQAALNVDGLGIIADVLQEEYMTFLLPSLFLVLTRAGSKQPLIQEAGSDALKKIANAFNCSNVTNFLNENMDYIVFYIERSLKRNNIKRNAFDVIEIIISYGDEATLRNLLNVVEEVLVQSCDRYKQHNLDSYIRIFKVFLKNLMRILNITFPTPTFKTKAQKKEEELKHFQVTGLEEEINDFSDDIMGKTAEEFFKEEMEKAKNVKKEEEHETEVEEYKKPEPPDHVKMTVAILKRSLNFLPSKNEDRKLIVLEILRYGIEIIKDYEDDLLPMVHLIWSPLINRFKDFNTPVIINYSFQLLSTLSRCSKDFIRNRTAKDILPSLLEVVEKLSKESFLKDRGSAYRYTQSYKLQIIILQNLANVINDIDLQEKDIEKTMDVIFLYLSNKQPIPLQTDAIKFFKLIIYYEPSFKGKIEKWLKKADIKDYEKNLKCILEPSEIN